MDRGHSRKHHVQRNAQLLSHMDMSEARRVSDDCISNKRLAPIIQQIQRRRRQIQRALLLRSRRRAQTIARLDAGSPAPDQHVRDALATPRHLAALDGIEAGGEARMLDHEGHELGRVAADAEELEAILLHEGLKGGMCCYTDPMAVGISQHLAQGHKGLDISPRAHDLNHDIQAGRGLLARLTTKTGRDIRWGERSLRRGRDLAVDGRREQICQSPVLGVDVDGDPAGVLGPKCRSATSFGEQGRDHD